MGTSRACRWVCRRLPLLAGGELAGGDRRRAERHLITCSSCRAEMADVERGVTFLQEVGAATRRASVDDAPSLWPSLARQIRESRHEVRPLAPRAWLDGLLAGRPRLRLGLGLAAAAGFALAVGLLARSATPGTGSAHRTLARAGSATPGEGRSEAPAPAASGQTHAASRSTGGSLAPLAQVKRRERALPDGQPPLNHRGVDPFQVPQPLRFDLDRGTLSGSNSQDTQRAY